MDTIPHLVFSHAACRSDEPAFRHRLGGEWITTTWGEYGAAVRRVAAALIASGIERGDRVAILSYNNPEWVIFDVAAMTIGAVPVGIYFSSTAEDIADVLDRSGARIVLVQTGAHTRKIDPAAHPNLDLVVGIDEATDGATAWSSFLERADFAAPDGVDERLAALRPADPATLIFTAAGHEHPAGVVLSHDNLVIASRSSVDLFDINATDSVLSYLPLSHIAEQIFTILAPAQVGYVVAFAQSIGRIRVDLPEIQPSIFFGVPLVWNGFARALRQQLGGLGGLKRRVALWSMAVTRRNVANGNAGRRTSLVGRIAAVIAGRTFTDRVRAAMGFTRVRAAFSGAAPADPGVLEFLAGVGVAIRQVYGLSEAAGPSAVTRPGADRYGTVGLPMPGVEIALADDGEILLRGRTVFGGYLDDDGATRHALRGGWLHTGDVGTIGSDGLLTVSGRKKDIVITNGGKNVGPGAIERLIIDDPSIVDAVVVGDGYDQLGVLVTVDGELADDPGAAHAHVQAVVDRANQRFSRAEQVRRVGVLPQGGPTTKQRGLAGVARRRHVLAQYPGEIEDLYR